MSLHAPLRPLPAEALLVGGRPGPEGTCVCGLGPGRIGQLALAGAEAGELDEPDAGGPGAAEPDLGGGDAAGPGRAVPAPAPAAAPAVPLREGRFSGGADRP
jgi:hypothetical protein